MYWVVETGEDDKKVKLRLGAWYMEEVGKQMITKMDEMKTKAYVDR